jgi:hypothetical protein
MQTHIPPQLNLIRERDERHIFSVLCDRSDEDTLRITQNLLAEMLGARRPSITNAARELEHAGLIERGRREVTILDRQGFIKASCECYQLVRERVAFHLPKTYTSLIRHFGNLHYRQPCHAGGKSKQANSCPAPIVSIRSASMPLTPYLKEAVFEPKAIEAMTAAFEAVCDSLKLLDRDDPITEIVARKVIEVAGTGERDPERIRELVLLALNESGERSA